MTEFEEFLAGVYAPLRFNRDAMDEIPNIGALHLLDGDERIVAEDILIAKLADNDGRAATALADADCVRAIPALIEATTTAAAPIMRVFAARALLRLGNYSGQAALVDMLRTHDGSATDRGSAARLLAEFPSPDKDLLLEAAAADPESTARSGALDALLTAVGLDEDDVRWGEVLLSIGGRLLSSLSTVRNEAAAEMRTILVRWEAGETADDLGLTWHADMATLLGEQLPARPRPALAEEGGPIVEDARWVRREIVGAATHLVERGGVDQRRPRVVGYLDAEPVGQAAHLALQVGRQVVVMHEDDVRLVAPSPRVGQVPHHTRERVQLRTWVGVVE